MESKEKMNGKKAYVCIVEFTSFEPEKYSELYTEVRLAALERIKPEKARMQSAAAELAYLAAARAAYEDGLFGARNAEALSASALKKRFAYSYAQSGKPEMRGAFLSLSHTSGAALAAVAPFPIGADIERERRVSERIAKRIMGESEYAEFCLLDENKKNARTLECWTAKESFLKLTGEGILAGLDKLFCDRENAKVLRAETGEGARLIRLDAASKVQSCELNADGGEAETENNLRSHEGKKLFACICAKAEVELAVIRFSSEREVAAFIVGDDRSDLYENAAKA